jgi:hypothetical protein
VRRSYLVEIQPVDYCYSLGNRLDFLYSSWVMLTPYIRVYSAAFCVYGNEACHEELRDE